MEQKNCLIFIVEDDIPCGMLIKYYLRKSNFINTILYTTENECLFNMKKKPDILITDFRLKSMDGISLVNKAKNIHPDFYCIFLSGIPRDEIFTNDEDCKYIDKYIQKSLSSIHELVNELDHYLVNQYFEK
jgi:response regulator RpfG family c-di-GMP phosphodiesterase